MKRILIVSEEDMTAVKLTELYHVIYGHLNKELYLCTMPILDCRSGLMTLPHQPKATKMLKNAPNPFRDYFTQSKPTKVVTAQNCKEIIETIKEHQISTVLLPNFLYDEERANHYNDMARRIKKSSRTEIIGIYL